MPRNCDYIALLAALALAIPAVCAAQEQPPPLPEISGAEEGPGLPPLPGITGSEEAVPPPPAEATWSAHLDRQIARLPFPLHGFWEARVGPRIVGDPDHSRDFSLAETRLRLESNPFLAGLQFDLKADLLYDFVLEEGDFQLREANVAFSPFRFMDVKAGRQILTWGTGDLIFLNDLFPKDYVSFFIGRDVEYLKAPSDAAKLSLFSDFANLDIVYTPQFDPDDFITGERLSYFNPVLGRRTGEASQVSRDTPDRWFRDDELALRIYRNIGGYELAGYGYRGFWKNPQGLDPLTGRFTFPRLRVCGASVRGPALKGIGNAEFAHYDSLEDGRGGDPFVRNSELRFLVGYSRDLPHIASDFTVGVQYYLEHMLGHGRFERGLLPGQIRRKENRHVLTLRLTKLLMNQDLRLDLFSFYSPSDDDVHLRPFASYRITDRWRIDGGANIFIGDSDHTMFGQLERNNNVYAGIRYSF